MKKAATFCSSSRSSFLGKMTSIRLSIGGDDNQEKEKDANAQLMELDKGLMSQKHGEQCEAIVRFPRLFEKYPFPILINSAFLKLGDVFRVGSNFLRLCVLKVTQQSEKHLDKILNVEEFLRRIFAVIYSNDPVARAITLRTLGSCAPVICDRKNVHHSIINGLDSHDAVEIDAAIYAATRFAEKSKDFASSICNKLAEMIQGLATPAEMKLKLIPIFQHMRHDAATATKVRQLCTEMLKHYPAEGSVCITLHTLSLLSAKSLLDLHEQVLLLLEYLHSDPRQNVKKLVLCDLNLLAQKGSHIWEQDQIQSLGLFGLNTPFQSLKIGALSVLIVLAKSIAVTKFSLLPGSEVVQLCNQVCYDSNITLAAKATSLIVYLAIHEDKDADGPSKLSEDAATALETMLIVSCTDSSAKNMAALKLCLQSTVEICAQCPSMTDRFVDIMISNLPNVTGDCAAILCECLASVSSRRNKILQNLVPDLLQTLKDITSSRGQSWETLTVWLLTLLFQALVDEDIADDTADFIDDLLKKLNAWNVYKVARQAARYRHHKVAARIFSTIVTEVSSEHLYFWLSALHQCSLAEICLADTPESLSAFTAQLNQAQTHYQKAISSLRAGSTPNFKHEFSCEFIRLRSEMLQAHLHLIKACCSFRTSPPPAIASSLAMTTHQEIHRFGHVVNHFQKCGQKFEMVYQAYGQLYQQSFDADPATLINVRLLQQSCQMMMHILESLLTSFQGSNKDVDRSMKLFETVEGSLIEHHAMLAAHQEAMNLLQQTLAQPTPAPLTHQHISCLEKVVMMVCCVPVCYPRYFFQSQQSTSIKLAISPLPINVTDIVTVHFDTGLTLKVEGVITHGNRPGLYRKVSKVQIHVWSKQETQDQMMPDTKVKENPTNEMVKTVEAHNDYFSCQLLLSFIIPGKHLVFVEAAVQDDEGVVWKTGPRSQMKVKCYDEAVHRQQQQQYAAAKSKLHVR